MLKQNPVSFDIEYLTIPLHTTQASWALQYRDNSYKLMCDFIWLCEIDILSLIYLIACLQKRKSIYFAYAEYIMHITPHMLGMSVLGISCVICFSFVKVYSLSNCPQKFDMIWLLVQEWKTILSWLIKLILIKWCFVIKNWIAMIIRYRDRSYWTNSSNKCANNITNRTTQLRNIMFSIIHLIFELTYVCRLNPMGPGWTWEWTAVVEATMIRSLGKSWDKLQVKWWEVRRLNLVYTLI